MIKTLYCVKLNQKSNKYLTAANIKNKPATLMQFEFDYAIFFESEKIAREAVKTYLDDPNCKMNKDNSKFITIEPVDFNFNIDKFPITNSFNMLDINLLKHPDKNIFRSVYFTYNNFEHFIVINVDLYNNLTLNK